MIARLLLTALFPLLGACDVFDASLYQDAEDAGVEDGGLATVTLADDCTGDVPFVESAGSPRTTTTAFLHDTFNTDIAACTGSPEPGNDGFFKVQMTAGDKWHFHMRLTDLGANPAVYVLRSCDERSCSANTSLDECGTGRDEHLSFRAPSTGTFIVGVDSRTAGGAAYEITVVNPICGNGGQPEHSETCDDGNQEDGDGCSSECRAEVSAAAPDEVEPNDESTNANLAMTDEVSGIVVVRGNLGGRCDFDMWAVEVPADATLRATMLDANGDPCVAGVTPFNIFLFQTNGFTTAGEGSPRGGNECPSFDETDSFAVDLSAGRHFVRVTTAEDVAEAVGYQLQLEVIP